jgi:hypothetical protein
MYLDKIVYNTEAHPLPNFAMGELFSTGWSRASIPRDGTSSEKPVMKEAQQAQPVQPAPPAVTVEVKETETQTMPEKPARGRRVNAAAPAEKPATPVEA